MTPAGFLLRIVVGFFAIVGFAALLALLQHCLEGRHPR
jgi:hypothetical protein